MVTDVRRGPAAVRARPAALKDDGDPATIMATWVAKYFASIAAARHASDAVQIHGANGCGPDYPVARLYRDAKIMEIIEGSIEIQQITIAADGLPGARHDHGTVTAVESRRDRPGAAGSSAWCGTWTTRCGTGCCWRTSDVPLRPEWSTALERARPAGHPALRRQQERPRGRTGAPARARARRDASLTRRSAGARSRSRSSGSPRRSTSASTRSPSSTTRSSSGPRWRTRTQGARASTRWISTRRWSRPEFNPRFVTDESAQRRHYYRSQLARDEMRARVHRHAARSSCPHWT